MAHRVNAILIALLGGFVFMVAYRKWLNQSATNKRSHYERVTAFSGVTGSLKTAGFQLTTRANSTKVILTWTNFFGKPMTEEQYLSDCPSAVRQSCAMTTDRSLAAVADAVVFHGRDLHWDDVPPRRRPSQRYVFLLHEAPPYTVYGKESDSALDRPGFFNWTMTYRRDSDIPYPYNYIIFPEKSAGGGRAASQLDGAAMLRSKNASRLVVWLVSNCHTPSKRELLVDRLRQSVAVDTFGKCGRPAPCGADCNAFVATYRFYVALENVDCKDYVTEKYWGRFKLDAVPIVMRRRTYEQSVPRGSFIAVDDYANVHQLAAHLRYLAAHDDAYLAYFAWRQQGYAHHWMAPGHLVGFCRLCEMLHDPARPPSTRTDLRRWWVDDAQCDAGEFVSRFIGALSSAAVAPHKIISGLSRF